MSSTTLRPICDWFGILSALTKCGEYVQSIRIDNCRNDDILLLLSECVNLKELTLYRCKSSFQSLTSITTLTSIKYVSCHFPQKIASEAIKNNESLRKLYLSDNTNVNVNEICENLSRCNDHMREIYFSERKKLRAKSLRTLGRLTKLRSLALVSGTGFECDPEDSLEQIAAGCSKLERWGNVDWVEGGGVGLAIKSPRFRLIIYGWKEINDDNLMPILHMCTQLRELDLRGLNITIRSCREAALSLPFLKTMDVIKCNRVKKSQLAKLKQDFVEIDIPLE
jgi:Leucine-rich repeat (LRR) protein